jgi:ribosome-binding protein aMBF1 (putative translation factor)
MRYESVVLENLQKNHQMLRRLAYLQQLKLSVVGRQREEMGLSMLFLAVLLNIHETTLMNIECGIALPTDNTGVRMNMLGIEVRLTESSPVLPLTRIEIQVYKKIKSMSQD